MFDETTKHQNRKQVGFLLRFWDEDDIQVATKKFYFH